MTDLEQEIGQREGFRGSPYIDSQGFATIGKGTKLPITEGEADLLLTSRLNACVAIVKQHLPFWDKLTPARQDVFSEMAYIMGTDALMKFTNTLQCAAAGDVDGVCAGMAASLWYREEPNRAQVLIAKYRVG